MVLPILDWLKCVMSVAVIIGRQEQIIADEFSRTSSMVPIHPVPVVSGSVHLLSLVAKRTTAHRVALPSIFSKAYALLGRTTLQNCQHESYCNRNLVFAARSHFDYDRHA
jgi:hypothetical protein